MSSAQGREVNVHVLVVKVEIDNSVPVGPGLLLVLDFDRSGGSADAVISDSSFGSLVETTGRTKGQRIGRR